LSPPLQLVAEVPAYLQNLPTTYDEAVAEVINLEARAQRLRLSMHADLPAVFRPLLQPSRYKGAFGGRGSGKSHVFAELLIGLCNRQFTRAVCVREYQTTLEQSVKRLLEDKINAFGLASFKVFNNYIATPFDGIIIFQGMQAHTSDSIKSLEGYHVAWVEEAQSLSQRSLDLLRPTIREEGSELWFSWNPSQPTDPVDKLLRADHPPDAVIVESSYKDNPYFPEVLRREMAWDLRRDVDKYEHVWMGGYEKHSEARVFKNWAVRDFETPTDATHRYGADWGFSVDPSVLVRCHAIDRTLYIDYEAYGIGVEIDKLGAFFDQVPGARDWQITADSARPETISYLNNHGFPRIVGARKGKDSVEEGIHFLQNFDVVVHSRCEATIREMTNYRYKTDPKAVDVNGHPIILPVLSDKDNHVIDSLRYATEGLRVPVSDSWLGLVV
jgi:phage terminase large subunit